MKEKSYCESCKKETVNIKTIVKDKNFTYDAIVCNECHKTKIKDTKELLLDIDKKESENFDYSTAPKTKTSTQQQLNKTIQENKEKGIPTCPNCGSTAIEAVNRGFSFLTGFVGNGKTLNYCKNCGYKWDPKKK